MFLKLKRPYAKKLGIKVINHYRFIESIELFATGSNAFRG